MTDEAENKKRKHSDSSRRRLVADFHFQPGVAAFGRKPHSSFFPKKCGGLPTTATTASEPPALLKRHRRGIFVAPKTKIIFPMLRVETTRAP